MFYVTAIASMPYTTNRWPVCVSALLFVIFARIDCMRNVLGLYEYTFPASPSSEAIIALTVNSERINSCRELNSLQRRLCLSFV